MRGLLPIEKDLLVRIGELVDGAINNRGPANPGINPSRITVRDKRLPPPRNLTVQTGPKSAKVEWSPVDSPILNFYEVEVTDLTSNIVSLELAFTSRVYLGGAGDFSIRVRSVSRSGTASPYSSRLSFSVQEDLLFLEGNTFGATNLGNFIREDIFTPEDYKVFSWGSFNPSGFVDPGSNPIPTMELSIGDFFYPVISKLFLFEESEGYSNLDDNTEPSMVRPGLSTAFRNGMFESPQAAMFPPFYLSPSTAESIKNNNTNFNLFLNDRPDATNLSLSMFSIPATVTSISEEILQKSTSIDLFTGSETLRTDPTENDGYRKWSFGNQLTIAFWVKYTSNFTPGDQFTYLDINNLPFTDLTEFEDGDGRRLIIRPGSPGGGFGEVDQILIDAIRSGSPAESGRFLGRYTAKLNNFVGKWIFVAITWDSTESDDTTGPNKEFRKVSVYVNGQKVDQEDTASSGAKDGEITVGPTDLWAITNLAGRSQALGGFRTHWIAVWDGLLGDGSIIPFSGGQRQAPEIQTLNANPKIDLRFPLGSYTSNASLLHWFRFGDDPTPILTSDLASDNGFGEETIELVGVSTDVLDNLVKDAPSAPGGVSS